MNTRTIPKLVIVLIILIALSVSIRHFAQAPAASNSQTASEGRYMDIESYVRNNINTIAPVKASLGGTFRVVSIETHGGAGSLEFEDGHMDYKADFTYTISSEGKPEIETFTLRK